ncbi:MAG TPA: 3'(2'),5'-bisphosphate nucleotidase CysQ [Arsenicitalea sp.]|nr:3'(2'),5'-bisphosphate nucleotidase CysQ [Arsenicitalea sp.]
MTEALLDIMMAASIAAAEVINEIYARPIVAESKADGSPVTEADSWAEKVILEHLNATGIPVLAEESVAAGYIPELGSRFFVVDPLDGTKEFIKRNGEFTVNIALVEAGRPVLGIVLAPVTGEAFAGGPDGAFAYVIRDGKALDKRRIQVIDTAPMRVVASRSHGHKALASLCETLAVEEDVTVGSSLKFCLLARGDAKLYPRFTPTSEWDTAAGQAVLEAAGGVVLTLDGKPLAYGKAEAEYLNPFFVAASNESLAQRAAAEMQYLTRIEGSH